MMVALEVQDKKQIMNVKFYSLMESQAAFATQAAEELLVMVKDKDFNLQNGRIAVIESTADKLVHEMSILVDSTFITPLDKEDLNILCSTLDDIIDKIESVASRIVIYNVKEIKPLMLDLSKKLVDICVATEKAVASLNNKGKNIGDVLISIHELENICDKTYREALSDLWKNETDFKSLVAWKDIYSKTEAATDACEHVATILERIRVKYYA
jgi:uncharacterized protein Yka (UPF0111/DUF47 family)